MGRTALALLTAGALWGERAVVECAADGWAGQGAVRMDTRELRVRGRQEIAFFDFRTSHIEGWKVGRATLMLHAVGAAPGRLEVAPIKAAWNETSKQVDLGLSHKIVEPQRQPQGWLAVPLDPAWVEDLAARRIHGFVVRGRARSAAVLFDARETLDRAAYIVVEGGRR